MVRCSGSRPSASSPRFKFHTPLVDDSVVVDVLLFRTSKGKYLEVLVTDSDPVQAVLSMRFSHHMVIANSEHLFCLFPRSTFIHRTILDFATSAAKTRTTRLPYFGDILFIVNPRITAANALDRSSEINIHPRFIGDRLSGMFSLREHGSSISTRYSQTMACSWQLWFVPRGPPQLRFVHLQLPELTYDYFLAPPIFNSVYSSLLELLGPRAGRRRGFPVVEDDVVSSLISEACSGLYESRFSVLLAQLQHGFSLADRSWPAAVQPSAAIAAALYSVFLGLPSLWSGTGKATINFEAKTSGHERLIVVWTLVALSMPIEEAKDHKNNLDLSDFFDMEEEPFGFDLSPSCLFSFLTA
ncbi:hypothetical protein VNI00_017653 [Paramarasmius palmivorus]